MIHIKNIVDYTQKTYKTMIGNTEFTVRHLIPVFIDEEARKIQKRRIESGLYDIFSKYMS